MNGISLWPAVGAVLHALETVTLSLSHSSVRYFYLRTGRWEIPSFNFYTQLGQSSGTLFL